MSHKIHQQNLFYLKLVLLVQSVSTRVGHQQTTPITNEQHGMTDTTQEQNYGLTTIIVEGLYLVMISKKYFVITKPGKGVEKDCKNGEINCKQIEGTLILFSRLFLVRGRTQANHLCKS